MVPTYSLRQRTSVVLQQHLELGLEEIPWALYAYCPGKKSHSFLCGWLDEPALPLTLSLMVRKPRKEVTLNLIPINGIRVLQASRGPLPPSPSPKFFMIGTYLFSVLSILILSHKYLRKIEKNERKALCPL